MRQKLHHISLTILSVYILSTFHIPVISLIHILEHLVEVTDFHHHHEHIHGVDEGQAHIHHHEHKTISFLETVLGEDKDEEDHERTIKLELEKHIIICIPGLSYLYPELLCTKFGFENYPLLPGYPFLLIPPPRIL